MLSRHMDCYWEILVYIYILPIYGKTLKLRPYAKKHDDMMLTANLNSSYSLELPQNMELQ